jgi:MFS transporter, DHA1 family, tetracycline resistance protein
MSMVRKLLPILGITFIDIVGFSMLIPMLPYFVTHFGVSAFVVGLLMSTFSLCQFVSAPLWGSVSDRIGRKMVLIISQIGATIGWAMLGLAPNIAAALAVAPITMVFVARIVEGISGGNISITQAYVADLVVPRERARAFGLISAMFAAGMVFGPLGGGILYGRFGFAVPFLVAAGLQAVTLALTIFMLPESHARGGEEERFTIRGFLASFSEPHLARYLWQKLAIALALYGWFAVFSLYFQRQLHFTLTETDYFFSIFAILNVFMNAFVVGRISTKLGDRWMSNLGLASLAVGFAVLPFVHDVPAMVGTQVFFAFGMALANTGITALISRAASDRDQGKVLGTSSSLDSLSGILAPPISTKLLAAYGPAFAGVESLTMTVIALLMGVYNARREPRPARSEDGTLVFAREAETAEIADG